MMQSLSMQILSLFKGQLERSIGAKVVVAPSPIHERGVVVKLSLFKTYKNSNLRSFGNMVKLRLAVEGAAETHVGLDQALAIIENIDQYLSKPINLESSDAKILPNTRITQRPSEEDSLLDNPDSTAVQDILDERLIMIYLSHNIKEVLSND